MVWFSRRYTRVIVFGSLFFFLTLLPALKFLPFWADRFFYIPSIGLCYLAGLAFQFFYTRWRRLGREASWLPQSVAWSRSWECLRGKGARSGKTANPCG